MIGKKIELIPRRSFITAIGAATIASQTAYAAPPAARLYRDQIDLLGELLVTKIEKPDAIWWRIRSLRVWRVAISNLCGERDYCEFSEITPDAFSLDSLGATYLEGYNEFLASGKWRHRFGDVNQYLHHLPLYHVEDLVAGRRQREHGFLEEKHSYALAWIIPQLLQMDLPTLLTHSDVSAAAEAAKEFSSSWENWKQSQHWVRNWRFNPDEDARIQALRLR